MRMEQTGAYLDLIDIAARVLPLWPGPDEPEELRFFLRFGGSYSFPDPDTQAQLDQLQGDWSRRSRELWDLMGWKRDRDGELPEDSKEDDRWYRAVLEILEKAKRKRKPATSAASAYRAWQKWKVTHQRANDRGELRGLTPTAANILLLGVYDFCRPSPANGNTLSGWSTQRILAGRAHTNGHRVREWLQRLHDAGYIEWERGKPGRPAKDGGGGQPMHFRLLSPTGIREDKGSTRTLYGEGEKGSEMAEQKGPGGPREVFSKENTEESASVARVRQVAPRTRTHGEEVERASGFSLDHDREYQSSPDPRATGTHDPDAPSVWAADSEQPCEEHGTMYCSQCHLLGHAA